MKNLIIRLGLWIARLGGLTEPAWDLSLQGYAKAGFAVWDQYKQDEDYATLKAYKTAKELSGMDSPELRFALPRELYSRTRV